MEPNRNWKPAAMWGLVLVLGCASAYSLMGLNHQRQRAEDLSASNIALKSSLDQVRGNLETMAGKLETLASRPEPKPAAAPRPFTSDPHWKQMQEKLASQQQLLDNTQQDLASARQDATGIKADVAGAQKDIAGTREDLTKTRDDLTGLLGSTRDQLTGSIAKSHDEIVALQKRGERNYFEFQLDRSKLFEKVGPFALSLRKADVKHKSYDVALKVDDQLLEKKHITLYEPVMFNLTDRPAAVELVVTEIHNNQVKGYVSEPKYKRSELTAQTR